jgi:hypothetical protein
MTEPKRRSYRDVGGELPDGRSTDGARRAREGIALPNSDQLKQAQPCSRNTDRKAHLDPKTQVGLFRYAESKAPQTGTFPGVGGLGTLQYAAPTMLDRAIGGDCSLLNRSQNTFKGNLDGAPRKGR